MAKPSACSVTGCKRAAQMIRIDLGTHSHFRRWCRTHALEFARLKAAQGKDWGAKNEGGFSARMYYASKRGYHSY